MCTYLVCFVPSPRRFFNKHNLRMFNNIRSPLRLLSKIVVDLKLTRVTCTIYCLSGNHGQGIYILYIISFNVIYSWVGMICGKDILEVSKSEKRNRWKKRHPRYIYIVIHLLELFLLCFTTLVKAPVPYYHSNLELAYKHL